jgi:hypothetical protein
MKVIAKKQEAITAVAAIEEDLKPYTTLWRETNGALPAPARRAIDGKIETIASLIRETIESEKQVESVVVAARDEIGVRLKAVSGGRRLARAYARKEPVAAGRAIDGES